MRGVQATPQAWVFRTFVRPRLAPTADWEAPEGPRFAQTLGLVFTAVAALLNAAFGFCLGCELFAIRRRLLSHAAPSTLSR